MTAAPTASSIATIRCCSLSCWKAERLGCGTTRDSCTPISGEQRYRRRITLSHVAQERVGETRNREAATLADSAYVPVQRACRTCACRARPAKNCKARKYAASRSLWTRDSNSQFQNGQNRYRRGTTPESAPTRKSLIVGMRAMSRNATLPADWRGSWRRSSTPIRNWDRGPDAPTLPRRTDSRRPPNLVWLTSN